MSNPYIPCPCGSGKKLKFCCLQALKNNSNSITAQFDKFPIFECRILADWKKKGISPVFVVRELGNGSYVLVSYLIDFECLGLKDTLIKLNLNHNELRQVYSSQFEWKKISYQEARSLVLGAIDFAKSIDIQPDKSWEGVILNCIEGDKPYDNIFTFGRDGVPFYSSGPYDHENYDVNQIVAKVTKANGKSIVHL